MTKIDAIAKAGGVTALARLLGISRSAVSQWDRLPTGRLYQLQIEQPHWFAPGSAWGARSSESDASRVVVHPQATNNP